MKSNVMMSEPSFRFLDLPPELRYMVYEELDMKTKHYTLDSADTPDQSSTITLVSKKLPVQILATSMLINTEAMKVFRPRMRQLKAQPMRFLIKAKHTNPLLDFGCRLSRCLRYRYQPENTPVLSKAAEAFVDRCVKSRRLSSSRPHVEIMVADKDAPSARQLRNMLCYSHYIAMRSHLEVTLLRKEPVTGIHDTNWQATQNFELAMMSINKRVHLHLVDEPDAERWRRDWEETTSASEA
ncbi:hypothetical protein BKA58DRAFT_470817 [Alternaria rosae]|uniref:uncharacterized protein n=1 Tax=Alternaria rosae TaxID=1187941 RepID=UPI001E8DC848|nr:uncharacterized protein BKA58DRAFT_470817 [Alternaria rosae]KAH6866524.1 hypothetical protein BKA58DRAFT_470817 [Alternaria rosae]